MRFEVVMAEPRPMLYLTRTATMEPRDVEAIMGEAFGAIGAFLATSGVIPAGPPIAVYRDWDMKTGTMKIDLGFPVVSGDAPKASGDVHSGTTPAGKALKAVHHGPYRKLRETYGALEAHMKQRGMPMSAMAWEVYVSDPDKTPEADLVTEVYMALP